MNLKSINKVASPHNNGAGQAMPGKYTFTFQKVYFVRHLKEIADIFILF